MFPLHSFKERGAAGEVNGSWKMSALWAFEVKLKWHPDVYENFLRLLEITKLGTDNDFFHHTSVG